MITILINKNKKAFTEKSAYVSFPYDNRLVDIMRSQPERYWHPEEKVWEIPHTNMPQLMENLDGFDIEIQDYTKTDKQEKTVNYKYTPKTKSYRHQNQGFEFGLKYDRFLLADEQGLGKTKQAIDIACYNKINKGYKHCLIVCGVNGLKWNWESEIKTHSNEKSLILGTRTSGSSVKIGGNNEKLDDLKSLNLKYKNHYFLIINVEALRNKEISDILINLISDEQINMMVIDEIHKCKNPQSQQGKAILKLQPKTRIALTGTPLMNTPLDLYIVMKWLGYENHNFWQFKNHYCMFGGYGGYEILGYKNMNELKTRFGQFTLRRLKSQVLDLPEKIRTTEYVEMTELQSQLYREILFDIKNNIDKIRLHPDPLSMLIRLRQATGNPSILSSTITESVKMDRMEELVEEAISSGEKVIIFSNWTSMTNPAFERLKKYNPAIITGEITDRQEQEKKFMTDENCKVIIGTTGAMGTGLTLTAGSTIIFLDSPWNRALKEQAEDRAHRIGTIKTVNIITLVCKNTIDERIEEIIYKKGAMADMMIDGKLKKKDSEILNLILQD